MTWSDSAIEAVMRLLGARTGLVFSTERAAQAEVGIRRAMARAGISDPDRYRNHIESDAAALDSLIVELTVGETYFFREPGQFEFIRRVILPALRTGRGPGHPVQAWSAGCASGEEAYSLAMLFHDEGAADHLHLLATDISRAALGRARKARFGAWSLRGEGADLARRHLRRDRNEFVVDEEIRRIVKFEYLNLAIDVYPSRPTGTTGLDLILCRNVLIYFDKATVRSVARRLYSALSEGGWLITASTDPPLGELAPFGKVVSEQGVFYRRFPPDAASCPPVPSMVVSPGLAVEMPGPFRAPAEAVVAREGPVTIPPDPVPATPARERPTRAEALASARIDVSEGHYERAVERTRPWIDDEEVAALQVRALANIETGMAERASADAIERHPLSSELHYLRAVLLMGLGQDDRAEHAARRVVYLDRSLAIAHFMLGSILRRRGDRPGARRAFRNARDLCAARPADEVVRLTDGEPAARLAESARLQMAQLELREEEPR